MWSFFAHHSFSLQISTSSLQSIIHVKCPKQILQVYLHLDKLSFFCTEWHFPFRFGEEKLHLRISRYGAQKKTVDNFVAVVLKRTGKLGRSDAGWAYCVTVLQMDAHTTSRCVRTTTRLYWSLRVVYGIVRMGWKVFACEHNLSIRKIRHYG